jgi:hypothetical protein
MRFVTTEAQARAQLAAAAGHESFAQERWCEALETAACLCASFAAAARSSPAAGARLAEDCAGRCDCILSGAGLALASARATARRLRSEVEAFLGAKELQPNG